MAAPNLVNPSTINGKTTYLTLSSTTETNLLSNAASSGKAMRITNVLVANIDGTASANITIKIYDAASEGTGYNIAFLMAVPAGSTLTVLSRDSSIWLEENRRIAVTASVANDLAVICSYEEVS